MGSWESYRPDAAAFPRSVLGRRYEGFPNERWLDIRRFHVFAGPLKRRFDICARKGFDAVEPDNLAGWENKTGFPITAAAQLRFNRWVARQVHARPSGSLPPRLPFWRGRIVNQESRVRQRAA